jgi:hypothetical protein
MNRFEAVSVVVVAALALGGLGVKYASLSRQAGTPDPIKPGAVASALPVPTLTAAARSFLSVQGAPEDRVAALSEFLSAATGPDLRDQALAPGDADTVGRAVSETLAASPDDSPDGLELRRLSVAFLARRVPSDSSREFVLKALEDGPPVLRDEALKDAGSPRGVRGPAVYKEIQDLASRGLVPPALLPGALRRTGGLKAQGELMTILKSTSSPVLINGCAVALQDYLDPSVMGPVLERLEQTGRLDSAGKLPWLSARLLSEHLKAAGPEDLRRGLTAMAVRPTLSREEFLRAGLQSGNPATRRVAAVAVKKAVVAGVLKPETGEEMLAGTLKTESEPVLKAELTGGLERVRGLIPKTTDQ